MATRFPAQKLEHQGGFSLVEVAVSMAIVAFTCVTLLGTLPMGLASFHQAMGMSVESQIVQGLSNDILLANFSDLYKYNTQTYYYDGEGSPLTTSQGAVFKATVSILGVDKTNSPLDITNNGVSTSSTQQNTSAYNVQISILNRTSNPTVPHAYSVIIANNNL